jgi:hypothetical protein
VELKTLNMMTIVEQGFENSDYSAEGVLLPDAPPGQLYNLSDIFLNRSICILNILKR